MTARVFVPSLPTRYDAATGEQVPTLDLRAALEFGELVVITKGPMRLGNQLNNAMGLVDDTIDTQDESTRYDYKRGDCILMIGDCVLNAVAVTAGINAGGGFHPVTVLRWNRKDQSYNEVEIQP